MRIDLLGTVGVIVIVVLRPNRKSIGVGLAGVLFIKSFDLNLLILMLLNVLKSSDISRMASRLVLDGLIHIVSSMNADNGILTL